MWTKLPLDLLVRIFMFLNILEVIDLASRVCTVWRSACSDPRLWEKIDLNKVLANLRSIPMSPYAWSKDTSCIEITRILNDSLRLSRGSTSCLVFNFYIQMSPSELIRTAERSSNIKKLVLPTLEGRDMFGFYRAVKSWKKLEFLTVPFAEDPVGVFNALGRSCKSLTHMKILFSLKSKHAKGLCQHIPHLKALSLRYTVIHRSALLELIDGLKSLEVLNLSHVTMVVDAEDGGGEQAVEFDSEVAERASTRVKTLVTCQQENKPCLLCQGTGPWGARFTEFELNDTEGEVWRVDELACFQV